MGAWAAGVLVELALALEGVEELEEERAGTREEEEEEERVRVADGRRIPPPIPLRRGILGYKCRTLQNLNKSEK